MSKAFTREDDAAPERPLALPRLPSLPPGAKNYLTQDGAAQFQAELSRLESVERPALAALKPDDPNRASLPRLDQRIRQLQQCLRTAVVVSPPTGAEAAVVKFGATTSIRDSEGEVSCYRIVGLDEVDFSRNWISWLSPLAKALQNSRPGQRVPFRTPSGPTELEVLSVTYE
jgi:transcription elongation factor GreB